MLPGIEWSEFRYYSKILLEHSPPKQLVTWALKTLSESLFLMWESLGDSSFYGHLEPVFSIQLNWLMFMKSIILIESPSSLFFHLFFSSKFNEAESGFEPLTSRSNTWCIRLQDHKAPKRRDSNLWPPNLILDALDYRTTMPCFLKAFITLTFPGGNE